MHQVCGTRWGQCSCLSLNNTPCPNVLGSLEWVGRAEGVEGDRTMLTGEQNIEEGPWPRSQVTSR